MEYTPIEFFNMIENFVDVNDISLEDIELDDFDYGTHNINALLDTTNPFIVEHGATRCCIIPDDPESNFVFKFDLSNLENNYCGRESYIYKEAKNWKLDTIFVKTYFFDNLYNTPIYIQEKVEVKTINNTRYTTQELKDISKKSSKYNKYFKCSPVWLKDFEIIYGKDTLDSFLRFCNTFGINDLHDANIGYTKEGKPIVFDYAGYEESSSSESSSEYNY